MVWEKIKKVGKVHHKGEKAADFWLWAKGIYTTAKRFCNRYFSGRQVPAYRKDSSFYGDVVDLLKKKAAIKLRLMKVGLHRK
jgi:hypothetical protein